MSHSGPQYDDTVLGLLAKFAVSCDQPPEDDVLSMMILLHTHCLTFTRAILPESPGVLTIVPRTQRTAADIAAQASHRLTSLHLYRLFNKRGPFEIMEDVPEDLAERVRRLRNKLLTHPDIASVEQEEEYNANRERAFAEQIDCCFPYNDAEAAERLIAEARDISLNAAFCVLHEICCPPHPSPVTRVRQQELLGQWMAAIDHPLTEAVLPCATALINREQLPPASAGPILARVRQFDGQLAALALALAATDNTAPHIAELEREIRHYWESSGESD